MIGLVVYAQCIQFVFALFQDNFPLEHLLVTIAKRLWISNLLSMVLDLKKST